MSLKDSMLKNKWFKYQPTKKTVALLCFASFIILNTTGSYVFFPLLSPNWNALQFAYMATEILKFG